MTAGLRPRSAVTIVADAVGGLVRAFRGGLLVAVVVLSAAGCGSSGPSTPTGSPPVPTSPVTGIITSVRSEGLDKVLGFTIRTASGQIVTFVVGRLDDPAKFPPGHLAEHQASLQPVTVFFTVVAGQLVAYHLDDG